MFGRVYLHIRAVTLSTKYHISHTVPITSLTVPALPTVSILDIPHTKIYHISEATNVFYMKHL